MKTKDKHHRKPTSRGGGNDKRNIIVVPQNHHRAYHLLFGNMIPKEMAKTLTGTWIDPDFYLVAIPRKKKQGPRNKSEVQQITISIPKGVKYEIETGGKKVSKSG